MNRQQLPVVGLDIAPKAGLEVRIRQESRGVGYNWLPFDAVGKIFSVLNGGKACEVRYTLCSTTKNNYPGDCLDYLFRRWLLQRRESMCRVGLSDIFELEAVTSEIQDDRQLHFGVDGTAGRLDHKTRTLQYLLHRLLAYVSLNIASNPMLSRCPRASIPRDNITSRARPHSPYRRHPTNAVGH